MTAVMITGTRDGMTLAQWAEVERLIMREFEKPGTHEWRDGDCHGADAQAHRTVLKMRGDLLKDNDILVVGYPSNVPNTRSYEEFDREFPEQPPLVRNRQMVNASDVVIAAPSGYIEIIRGSGTWATIRYARLARERGKVLRLVIVWPDGKSEDDLG